MKTSPNTTLFGQFSISRCKKFFENRPCSLKIKMVGKWSCLDSFSPGESPRFDESTLATIKRDALKLFELFCTLFVVLDERLARYRFQGQINYRLSLECSTWTRKCTFHRGVAALRYSVLQTLYGICSNEPCVIIASVKLPEPCPIPSAAFSFFEKSIHFPGGSISPV